MLVANAKEFLSQITAVYFVSLLIKICTVMHHSQMK